MTRGAPGRFEPRSASSGSSAEAPHPQFMPGSRRGARLERASAIDLGFPHEFIAGVRQTPFVLGDAHARIDDHRAERSGLAHPSQDERLEREPAR
jgi:hypothetical protein